jgi:hypothetical protein
MTTLMYAVLAPGEIGVDTRILMIIAVLVELTTWGIGAFANCSACRTSTASTEHLSRAARVAGRRSGHRDTRVRARDTAC